MSLCDKCLRQHECAHQTQLFDSCFRYRPVEDQKVSDRWWFSTLTDAAKDRFVESDGD